MGKVTRIVDGYVRLDLRNPGDFGSAFISQPARSERELKADLETLRRAAQSRLNKYDDECGGAQIITERETVCEHCGSKWTEGDSPHNGGCCEKDCIVYEAEEADAERRASLTQGGES